MATFGALRLDLAGQFGRLGARRLGARRFGGADEGVGATRRRGKPGQGFRREIRLGRFAAAGKALAGLGDVARGDASALGGEPCGLSDAQPGGAPFGAGEAEGEQRQDRRQRCEQDDDRGAAERAEQAVAHAEQARRDHAADGAAPAGVGRPDQRAMRQGGEQRRHGGQREQRGDRADQEMGLRRVQQAIGPGDERQHGQERRHAEALEQQVGGGGAGEAGPIGRALRGRGVERRVVGIVADQGQQQQECGEAEDDAAELPEAKSGGGADFRGGESSAHVEREVSLRSR